MNCDSCNKEKKVLKAYLNKGAISMFCNNCYEQLYREIDLF